MKAISDHPNSSGAELARHLSWISRKGEPQRFKVSRIVKDLKKHKLVNETRAGLTLTESGKKAVKQNENQPRQQIEIRKNRRCTTLHRSTPHFRENGAKTVHAPK